MATQLQRIGALARNLQLPDRRLQLVVRYKVKDVLRGQPTIHVTVCSETRLLHSAPYLKRIAS